MCSVLRVLLVFLALLDGLVLLGPLVSPALLVPLALLVKKDSVGLGVTKVQLAEQEKPAHMVPPALSARRVPLESPVPLALLAPQVLKASLVLLAFWGSQALEVNVVYQVFLDLWVNTDLSASLAHLGLVGPPGLWAHRE